MAQGDRYAYEWWEAGVGDLEWCLNQIDEQKAADRSTSIPALANT